MPYRRLPNTDAARLKSLEAAEIKGSELPPFKLAYSQCTYNKVMTFLPSFKKAMNEHRLSHSNQVNRSQDYLKDMKKAKLYISHFIQVLNMAISRGEMPKSTRTFFGIDEDCKRIPSLNSEEDILIWGENIIKGETERVRQGLSPITNPTIAVVKVRYEKFLDSYRYQKTLQKTNSRTLKELAKLRDDADKIIQTVWNEVEDTYCDLPDDTKRERCREYGITYVYRRNEIKNMRIPIENSKIEII